MTSTTNSGSVKNSFPLLLILKAGLITGTSDITLAFLYSYIKRGTAPSTVLQYISKFAFGNKTFSNPAIAAITGLLVHFAIAMAWSFLFFSLYHRLKLMKQNKIITGIIYGLVVWVVMNIIVLPLWNDKPFVFNPESASINAVILIIAIGLPLSFIASWNYRKRNSL